MIGLPIKMLPARKGNRLGAPVLSDKTTALGWAAKYFLKDYIKDTIMVEDHSVIR